MSQITRLPKDNRTGLSGKKKRGGCRARKNWYRNRNLSNLRYNLFWSHPSCEFNTGDLVLVKRGQYAGQILEVEDCALYVERKRKPYTKYWLYDPNRGPLDPYTWLTSPFSVADLELVMSK